MGQGESEPQEEAEVGNATAAGWGDGVRVPPIPRGVPPMGLSLLSPQDASLTAVLPRLFADEPLSTGAVSATNSSPRPWGQRPGPQILPPSAPTSPTSPSLCPKGRRSPLREMKVTNLSPCPRGHRAVPAPSGVVSWALVLLSTPGGAQTCPHAFRDAVLAPGAAQPLGGQILVPTPPGAPSWSPPPPSTSPPPHACHRGGSAIGHPTPSSPCNGEGSGGLTGTPCPPRRYWGCCSASASSPSSWPLPSWCWSGGCASRVSDTG